MDRQCGPSLRPRRGPLLERLNELTRCDCTTRNAKKAATLAQRMDELEARIEQLAAQEELQKIKPALDGQQIMEFLGIPPGPLVGQARQYLLDLRLDEGPMPEAVAYERLERWAKENGLR